MLPIANSLDKITLVYWMTHTHTHNQWAVFYRNLILGLETIPLHRGMLFSGLTDLPFIFGKKANANEKTTMELQDKEIKQSWLE